MEKEHKLNKQHLKELMDDIIHQRNKMMVLHNKYLERWLDHPALGGVVKAINALEDEIGILKYELQIYEVKNESDNNVADCKGCVHRSGTTWFDKLFPNGLGALLNNRTLKNILLFKFLK